MVNVFHETSRFFKSRKVIRQFIINRKNHSICLHRRLHLIVTFATSSVLPLNRWLIYNQHAPLRQLLHIQLRDAKSSSGVVSEYA